MWNAGNGTERPRKPPVPAAVEALCGCFFVPAAAHPAFLCGVGAERARKWVYWTAEVQAQPMVVVVGPGGARVTPPLRRESCRVR